MKEVIKLGIDNTFKALSDKNRRDILDLLRDKPMKVGEIAEHFQMSGATLSYHLSLLKEAELIFETKEKNYRIYSLNTSVFEEILYYLFQFKEEK